MITIYPKGQKLLMNPKCIESITTLVASSTRLGNINAMWYKY